MNNWIIWKWKNSYNLKSLLLWQPFFVLWILHHSDERNDNQSITQYEVDSSKFIFSISYVFFFFFSVASIVREFCCFRCEWRGKKIKQKIKILELLRSLLTQTFLNQNIWHSSTLPFFYFLFLGGKIILVEVFKKKIKIKNWLNFFFKGSGFYVCVQLFRFFV